MMKKIGIVLMALACFELVYSPLIRQMRLPTYEGNAERFTFKPLLNIFLDGEAFAQDDSSTPAGCAKQNGMEWNDEMNRCVEKKSITDSRSAESACKGKEGVEFLSCLKKSMKDQCYADANADKSGDAEKIKAKKDLCDQTDSSMSIDEKSDRDALFGHDLATVIIFGALILYLALFDATQGENICSSSLLIMFGGFLILTIGEIAAHMALKGSADTIKNVFYNTKYANQQVVDKSDGYDNYTRNDVSSALSQIQVASYDSLIKLQQAYLGYLQTRQAIAFVSMGIFFVAGVFATAEWIAKLNGAKDVYSFDRVEVLFDEKGQPILTAEGKHTYGLVKHSGEVGQEPDDEIKRIVEANFINENITATVDNNAVTVDQRKADAQKRENENVQDGVAEAKEFKVCDKNHPCTFVEEEAYWPEMSATRPGRIYNFKVVSSGSVENEELGENIEKFGCDLLGDDGTGKNVGMALGGTLLVAAYGVVTLGNVLPLNDLSIPKSASNRKMIKEYGLEKLVAMGEVRNDKKLMETSIENIRQSNTVAKSHSAWKDFLRLVGGGKQSLPYTHYQKLSRAGFKDESPEIGGYVATAAERIVGKILN